MLLTAVIVVLTYAGIAIGQVPGTRMNRATIALVGAAALMVLNNNLRMAGFFRLVTSRALRRARGPRTLLALIIAASGVLSALFLNDTICLMLTPLVVSVALRLQRDPIPYLIGLAVATNVGSVATITGNPQNIIIGQASGISYLDFMLALTPVALLGLVVCWVVVMLAYPQEFRTPLIQDDIPAHVPYYPLLNRTLAVVVALLVAFAAGAPIVTSACLGAGVLLISRLRPQKLMSLDYDLLLMFAGLFVVTGAIEQSGLASRLSETLSPVLKEGIGSFTLVVGVLSNVVSNVPAVLLLRSEIPTFADPRQAWLALAMASTLAGNLTLLGSAATLIVAELAAGRGVQLGFAAFLKVGVPVTLLTLVIGMVWLSVGV
jgi:Na+/H+ antiporter NhaD/arsenite permease-like protein